ncbi:MAG: cAMP-binding putative transcriptional regulator [Rhodobacteraceae bacterium HLUCCA08]|nr:MAG: cAMP-binding putative transcriptional regulator [Rhodobacteraceae bacterium HLUCCA08]
MIAIMSDALASLFTTAPSVRFGAGDTLLRAGERVTSMLLLQKGRVDLVRHTGQGLRMILQNAGPGQILAEASAWSDRYHCDAVATTPGIAARVPRDRFRARLASDPKLSELWARRLAQSLQHARLRAEIRAMPRVADRLDTWLDAGNRLPERGQWQDLAAELGITREALYRELGRRRRGPARKAAQPGALPAPGPSTPVARPTHGRSRTKSQDKPGPADDRPTAR